MRTCEIHCDSCSWSIIGVVPEWHNKACPECGAVPVISDEDLKIFNYTNQLIDAGILTTDLQQAGITLEIDTSFLRNK